MKLNIRDVELENNIILAPMAGVSDLPFRLLCREQGAGLVCMEMVSAKAIFYNNKNTHLLMRTEAAERPVSLQLFGNDPELISEMARRIEHLPFDILDINMGCPVPKVVNNQEGSALMKEPKLAGEIVARTTRAIQKPVTAKIRIGFDEEHINAVEMAKILEDAGAAAITVHGRTRQQYYSGKADWDQIRQVKEQVQIPVIGNGDVSSGADARRMMEETGCDGVMVGRAARGNPFLFREINQYLDHHIVMDRPDSQELREMILRHGRMQIQYMGEHRGIRQMRKHVAWYTAGLKHSAALRQAANGIETYEDLERLVMEHIQ